MRVIFNMSKYKMFPPEAFFLGFPGSTSFVRTLEKWKNGPRLEIFLAEIYLTDCYMVKQRLKPQF